MQHFPCSSTRKKVSAPLPITMKPWTVLALLLVLVAHIFAFPAYESADNAVSDEVLGRVYRTMLLKAKRSPSIGLSLAEYMASPQGQDNFHFIPSGHPYLCLFFLTILNKNGLEILLPQCRFHFSCFFGRIYLFR
uniref:Uncharacterized protein n=1 Tax=Panagrolaimus sp. JU765 TaxID=591449 RepID=A0AC34Q5H2_9BILA